MKPTHAAVYFDTPTTNNNNNKQQQQALGFRKHKRKT